MIKFWKWKASGAIFEKRGRTRCRFPHGVVRMFFRTVLIALLCFASAANAGCEWAESAEKSGKNAIALMQYMYCAEEENDPEAQYKLASMFYQGKNFKKPDFKRSVVYFSLAARNGYAPAQAKLGLLYWRGEGIEKDMNEAFKWLYLAQEPADLRWFYKAGATTEPAAKKLYDQISRTDPVKTMLENDKKSPNGSVLFPPVAEFQRNGLTSAGERYLSPTDNNALLRYLDDLANAILSPDNFDLKKTPVLNILKNKMYPPVAN